jgi:hypothetical protein
MSMHEVFINYRTDDGNTAAALINKELIARFGDGHTFFASRSIKAGEPFPDSLLRAVRRCHVLLAVIGPDWANAPLLGKKEDWVTRELLEARAFEIPVVPVLAGGRSAKRLDPAGLPTALRHLAKVQSLRLDTRDYDSDLARIGDRVAEIVPWLAQAGAGDDAPSTGQGLGADAVSNSTGTIHGPSLQGRDFTVGDLGNVYNGPVHTGKGDQSVRHFNGDGTTYFEGGNQGGLHQHFGDRRRGRDEDDAR